MHAKQNLLPVNPVKGEGVPDCPWQYVDLKHGHSSSQGLCTLPLGRARLFAIVAILIVLIALTVLLIVVLLIVVLLVVVLLILLLIVLLIVLLVLHCVVLLCFELG
jgi:hypothetical protein